MLSGVHSADGGDPLSGGDGDIEGIPAGVRGLGRVVVVVVVGLQGVAEAGDGEGLEVEAERAHGCKTGDTLVCMHFDCTFYSTS